MKIRQGLVAASATVVAMVLPTLAFAHPGHGLSNDFTAGVMHPWSGLDHLAAMVAVGMWAAQLGGYLRWTVPMSFIAMMLMGATLGMSGIHSGIGMGVVEQGIAASVCVLGLLIAGAARLPALLCVALTGSFAVFHGYAHGVDAPQQVRAIQYMSGFVLSSLALQAAGFVLANWLVQYRQPTSLRWVGAVMAMGGLALFAV